MNKRFSQQWLKLVCQQLPDVDAAIFMMPNDTGDQLVTLAKWPNQLKNAEEFAQVVQYTLKKREQVCFAAAINSGEQTYDLFAVPIAISAKLPGVVVIKIKSQGESKHKAIFSRLKLALGYLRLAGSDQVREDDFYSRIVGLLASCFEQESYHKGLVSMVTELTRTFQCDRVAYAEFQGHYNRVVASS